jgi:hypothetical protein
MRSRAGPTVVPMPDHAPASSLPVQERLRRRARQISRIRRRVAALALVTFALAFGVIAHDGSMGATTPSSTQVAADSSIDSSSNGSGSSSGTSPMTTQQS